MLGDKPPGRLNLSVCRPGRCPWCCRRHSEHQRLTFCPCRSADVPPNVKLKAAPYPTFNTNKYPGPSSLSPSRSLQADRSSKSFWFFSSRPNSEPALISGCFKTRSGGRGGRQGEMGMGEGRKEGGGGKEKGKRKGWKEKEPGGRGSERRKE